MNINSLKHEVELLHKTLNINQTVPDWKKQSEEILDILKEIDQLNIDEKQRQNEEAIAWHKGEFKQSSYLRNR